MTDTQILQNIAAGQQRMEAAIARIEANQDELLAALREDDEPQQQATLEGADAGRDRDQTQSLDPSDPK
jgi:hypothetical protein